MKLNELQPKTGSTKTKVRVGRGIGSGKGKTCGVGQKGQKSRSGVAIKGFEGGQMPIYMRMPKSGFNNKKFATVYTELSLGHLQAAIDDKKIDAKKAIDEDALVAAGVVRRKNDGVKLLANGELKSKVELKISKATKGATEAVEKAGGKVEIIVHEVAPVKKRGEK
ncbi:MAG: 50S ribosomal protein L15 [Micavibrio sp. TMED27]|nr:50S ribosomal protein L15 [Micavibrio sp.]OUT90588.1 MAG: 50S ribosomal protein L15 [Micavibrio sp. TMED27]|tara:strand:- start:841 stop:1338 length:498 start_codon:yes stop_codon:yes gene_type:complete